MIHSPGQCGVLQSTPHRGPTSSSAHIRLGIGSDTKLSHLGPGPTISRAQLRRSTILSALGLDQALTVLFLGTHTRPFGSSLASGFIRTPKLSKLAQEQSQDGTILSALNLPFPHGFVFGNSDDNFPMDHPS
ncbi:hypothetical protein DVH24_000366 [Malus domestica]|uniref:Uncharacterized protein n=1 Tax=Malus domestica TaxID=3750 RepID=A0A498J2F7_MALDO|nr:hypothetical protein DVH24_000366 [Malus domestica]